MAEEDNSTDQAVDKQEVSDQALRVRLQRNKDNVVTELYPRIPEHPSAFVRGQSCSNLVRTREV